MMHTRPNNKCANVMTLAELIENLDSLDDDLAIYVRADPTWTRESEAIALPPPAIKSTTPPTEASNVNHFLPIAIAKELIDN